MITGVFAKPGSGKTIYLVLAALESSRRHVFSTSYIKGTYKLEFDDLSVKQLPEDSLILIDEIASFADNRDFKTTKKGFVSYVANHRHYDHGITWCSQLYDGVDKKVRNNTQALYQISMVGLITFGNPDRRPLLGLYAKAPAWLSWLLSKIWFVRPRVKLRRYVPCVGYQRPYKGGFGMLVDGHDTLAEGLAGLIQRLFQPGYWVRKITITQASLKAYDTHDDQIGYRKRPMIELKKWGDEPPKKPVQEQEDEWQDDQ